MTEVEKQAMTTFYLSTSQSPVCPSDPYLRMRQGSLYPVKQVSVIDSTDPNLNDLRKLLLREKYFNMIPVVDTYAWFYGFLLRMPDTCSMKFKTYRFGDFFIYGLDTLELYDRNQTLVLVEGAKDCEAIRHEYPYCLAYLTSFPDDNQIAFIKRISRRIIMIGDNDHLQSKMARKAESQGFCHIVTPEKDPGWYFENEAWESLNLFLRAAGVIR